MLFRSSIWVAALLLATYATSTSASRGLSDPAAAKYSKATKAQARVRNAALVKSTKSRPATALPHWAPSIARPLTKFAASSTQSATAQGRASRPLPGPTTPTPCGFLLDPNSGQSATDPKALYMDFVYDQYGFTDTDYGDHWFGNFDDIAYVALSLDGANWVIEVLFPDLYEPVDNESYLQLYVFEDDITATTWYKTRGSRCDPGRDGLRWFLKWGNTTALSTLPPGSKASFSDNYVQIIVPIQSASLPWTWGQSLSDMCQHFDTKGPSAIGVRAYNKDVLDIYAKDHECTDDVASGYTSFVMTCSCPPPTPAPCNFKAGCNSLESCVDNQCVSNGGLSVSLVWNRAIDMDLYLGLPDGKLVYFKNSVPTADNDYAFLAFDNQLRGPEDIFWPSPAAQAPTGNYTVCVNIFGNIDGYEYYDDYGNPIYDEDPILFRLIIDGLSDGTQEVNGEIFMEQTPLVLSGCADGDTAGGWVASFTV